METRSCLELMLDRLQQLEDQPKDEPPALPVRPVLRARRPGTKRRPLPVPLHLQVTCPEENGVLESKSSTKRRSFVESFRQEDNRSNGCALPKGIRLMENSDGILEKGVSNIQRCYRGHKARCRYKKIRNGVIALQSFVRGENVRRGYNYRSKKRTAGDSRNLRVEGDEMDQIEVQYSVIVDLQKQILRTEAKVREKNEENLALKKHLQEMEKRWRRYEERMKSLEKSWQDQLLSIQKRLAASKRDPASSDIQIRRPVDSNQGHCNQNANGNVIDGTPNGNVDSFAQFINQRTQGVYDEDGHDIVEVQQDQISNKMHPYKELQKLKLKLKVWKKEYKNKLREAQSTFKKLSHSETAKGQKNWWGRFSH